MAYGKVPGFIKVLVTSSEPELQYNGQQLACVILLPAVYCNLPQRASGSMDYTSANEVVNTALHILSGLSCGRYLQIPCLFNDAVSNSDNVACNY
jgi:hypothetical protein